MHGFRYRDGQLRCGRVPVGAIAERFGTPVYVYSRAALEANLQRVERAFEPLQPTICFSVKACANVHVLRVMVARGAGLDVVSAGELERARVAGCPMERVVFAGAGKTDAELAAALGGPVEAGPAGAAGGAAGRLDRPVGWINVESAHELGRLARLARRMDVRARVAVRINPDIDAGTHAYTATGARTTKFGVDYRQVPALVRRYAGRAEVCVDGLHVHVGSSLARIEPYVAAVRRALAVMDELGRWGIRVRSLNLGGGFGVRYGAARVPGPGRFAEAVMPLLLPRLADGLEVMLEPGRVIAAEAGVLLTRVVRVKRVGARRIVICDAGMPTLLRPALYGAFHFVWPVGVAKGQEPRRWSSQPGMPGLAVCDVVGPVCETGDVLALDRHMPPPKPGTLLAIFCAGAYGMTMASTYNAHPLPAEVLVERDGPRLIRPRQTIAEQIEPELRCAAGPGDAAAPPHRAQAPAAAAPRPV